MTERSGVLERDEVWEGEVLLTGDVVVPEGVTLRLAPGAAVAGAPRPRWSCAVFRSAPEGWPVEASGREVSDLVVRGRLVCEGTPERPVLLGAGDALWGGVLLLGTACGELRHAAVRGGGECSVQAFDDSELALEDCRLEGAEVGVWARGLARAAVRGGGLAASRCAVLACEGAEVELRDAALSLAPQGCSLEDWALLRADACRFSGGRDFAVAAGHRSWAVLTGCDLGGAQALPRDQGRVDVR